MLGNVIKVYCASTEAGNIDRKNGKPGDIAQPPQSSKLRLALYSGHSVSEISRSDASAINLSQTSESISSIIRSAKASSHKAICFVTGVPGAGKTLVGLNIATTHIDKVNELTGFSFREWPTRFNPTQSIGPG